MKSYKDFKEDYIGSSDIAALIAVGCGKRGIKSEIIHFFEDASYDAYIVNGEAEISSHYIEVATFNHWLKIYDDNELVKEFKADTIKVYRAGDFGCIIQLLD